MRFLGLQRLDNLKEVAYRARQTVEAHHYEDITWLHFSDEPRQNWPGSARARPVLLVDLSTPGSAQLVKLGIVRLVLGRNACIADEASFREGRGH